MYEADAGIELRVTRQAFFQPRHADQNEPDIALVENRAYLFHAVYPQPVRLVNDDQAGGIFDGINPPAPFDRELPHGRLGGEDAFTPLQPVAVLIELRPGFLFLLPCFFQLSVHLLFELPHGGGHVPQMLARIHKIKFNLPGRVRNGHRVKDAVSVHSLLPGVRPSAGFQLLPFCVMAGRQSFPDTGRPVAQANVTITAAILAELREFPVFPCLNERGCRHLSRSRKASAYGPAAGPPVWPQCPPAPYNDAPPGGHPLSGSGPAPYGAVPAA